MPCRTWILLAFLLCHNILVSASNNFADQLRSFANQLKRSRVNDPNTLTVKRSRMVSSSSSCFKVEVPDLNQDTQSSDQFFRLTDHFRALEDHVKCHLLESSNPVTKKFADQALGLENHSKKPRLEVPNTLTDKGPCTVSSSSSSSQVASQPTGSKNATHNCDHISAQLNGITLDGRDVAVSLWENGSFFLDLPFLDCVLPSMQAGEFYFVPAFIQNILFPYWKYGRNHLLDYERTIIALTGNHLYPAMAEYLELLFLAAVLEMEQPLDVAKISESERLVRLQGLALWFFGIRFVDLFADEDLTPPNLRYRIMLKQQKIPAILMIGHQWGFDAKLMAKNIIKMWYFNRDRRVLIFLNAVAGGVFPPPFLKTARINWIAWTMYPEFEFGVCEDQKTISIRHKIRFETKNSASVPLRRHSFAEILSALETMGTKQNPDFAPLALAAASKGNHQASSFFKTQSEKISISSTSNPGTQISIETTVRETMTPQVSRPPPIPASTSSEIIKVEHLNLEKREAKDEPVSMNYFSCPSSLPSSTDQNDADDDDLVELLEWIIDLESETISE